METAGRAGTTPTRPSRVRGALTQERGSPQPLPGWRNPRAGCRVWGAGQALTQVRSCPCGTAGTGPGLTCRAGGHERAWRACNRVAPGPWSSRFMRRNGFRLSGPAESCPPRRHQPSALLLSAKGQGAAVPPAEPAPPGSRLAGPRLQHLRRGLASISEPLEDPRAEQEGGRTDVQGSSATGRSLTGRPWVRVLQPLPWVRGPCHLASSGGWG